MQPPEPTNPDAHPFLTQPHKTILALSVPATLSLIAEPITGLVDTAFVSQLGSAPLAAVGVGTAALSLVLWIFNFLSIGTQTEVAKALGKSNEARAANITSLALLIGTVLSLLLALMLFPGAPFVARLLGASDAVLSDAVLYVHIRLLGGPAVLLTLIGMGALRGMQDMRTPLIIAVAVNVLNMALDAPLIFGWGAVPALGVAGSAVATVVSQWIGTIWVLRSVHSRLGLRWHTNLDDTRELFTIGGDLFVRTALLVGFLMYATRVANQISPEAGAAHQAIRTVWMFASFIMEGYANTAQSLVGYFLGADRVTVARRAAGLTTLWSVGSGAATIALLLPLSGVVMWLLVPDSAQAIFYPAWIAAVIAQPLSGLAFVTDGIHWGTSDYRFLRNEILIATLIGGICLALIDTSVDGAFLWVWVATGVWIAVRGVIGIARVYPGFGQSPLRSAQTPPLVQQ